MHPKVYFKVIPMLLMLILIMATGPACNDDPDPSAQDLGVRDQDLGVRDLDNSDRGARDLSGPGSDATMPWPDLLVKLDATQWSCVPEEANMCGGDKNQFCENSLCTQCPVNYKDCNRMEDCECFGGCKDKKCAVKH